MFHTIVVGTDLSPESMDALRMALRLARRDDAQVIVVHVSKASAEEADRALSDALAPLSTRGVELETAIMDGTPSESILKVARARGADLIMVAPTGKGLMQRLLLGSTSRALLADATLPVWIARPDSDHALRRVIVGIDGTDHALHVLQAAAAQASLERAILDVVHVAPEDTSEQLAEATEGFERFCAKHHLRIDSERVEHHILTGDPSASLARHALDTDADLIVVGSRDHGLLHDTFVGSTAARILSDTPCCMVVVRDPSA